MRALMLAIVFLPRRHERHEGGRVRSGKAQLKEAVALGECEACMLFGGRGLRAVLRAVASFRQYALQL